MKEITLETLQKYIDKAEKETGRKVPTAVKTRLTKEITEKKIDRKRLKRNVEMSVYKEGTIGKIHLEINEFITRDVRNKVLWLSSRLVEVNKNKKYIDESTIRNIRPYAKGLIEELENLISLKGTK